MPSVVHEMPVKRQKRFNLDPNSKYIQSSLRLNLPKHPLGIKPSGNLLISTDEQLSKINQSMGLIFAHLSDELILKVIGYLDNTTDLCNLMSSSKFFYGFISFDEIWKNLYLNHLYDLKPISEWKGSWKKSILKIDETSSVNCDFIYSDLIYIPYQNSQINYQEIFKNLIDQERKNVDSTSLKLANLTKPNHFPKGCIPRLSSKSMTYEIFNETWHDHPFILKDESGENSNNWPNWTLDSLSQRFPTTPFRQECVEWPIQLYSQYTSCNVDENPLYLFDCNSTAMKQLKTEFTKPKCFQTDYFNVFNELELSCRPDNTWLITGPHRSGSTFHKDPNATSAWNTILQGMKLWILMPGEMTPPGIHTSKDESEVMAPLGLAEWVLSGFYNDTVKLAENSIFTQDESKSILIFVAFENECVYVPSGWWHSVINLQDTVALTGNFVPGCKIGTVLNFFKNKKDQISGFRRLKFRKFVEKLNDENQLNDECDECDLKLKNFLQLTKDSKLDDEDVGELNCDVELPVYELFVKLVKLNGYEKDLQQGLSDLLKIENESIESNIVKSQLWETLTKEKSSGFSFGFNDDDDDDDDE
ncbi:hypothetical protein CANARDRAFT_9450 [[Candida] arabinofermentans NRRL YB-2248]|uniref:JmjC domain-containing protein n=1 Tax=[Candida] arabinofermentans NRRL YB-2248 TaxID=983967 RepID=A0A1E4SVW0_9ASCO|nr:hypothetical protein CANARDRAFT_9450 [[Candida] arabinofermentans NRRL YB-2248]